MIAIERGKRLKLCRGILKKTLKELRDTHQVSIGALSNWESGTSPITEKNVHKIMSFLAAEGLIASKEWLLEGQGDLPYVYTPQEDVGSSKPAFDLTSHFLFFKEIDSFKKNHPEMLVTVVRDDGMAPFLRVGDYVGGPILSKSDYANENGRICILEIQTGEFIIRQLFLQGDKIFLLCVNPKGEQDFLFLEEAPLSVAPLTFMRRS